VAFGSGMGAVAAASFAFAAGGEILVSESVYGGSTELLRDLGPRHGIRPRFLPAWDTDAVRAAVGPETRAILVETITNPTLRVADLAALGELARERGLALIVDSTFATPVLVRPLALGATVVLHSASKYIGGHGDLLGGVVAGSRAALTGVVKHRKLVGAVMDPLSAWLAVRGLRTMPLRVERQCATAARLADVLATIPSVRRVFYPGRADHPDHARARKLLSGFGAIVTFELADGAAARRFFDRVRVIARAASLGEVASLLTHPASFSHKALSAEERARTGIPDGLLRLSVGIEDAQDLEDDVRQALA
jgi:cystathionine beta-lyase/cystathionine gamma-synthase